MNQNHVNQNHYEVTIKCLKCNASVIFIRNLNESATEAVNLWHETHVEECGIWTVV